MLTPYAYIQQRNESNRKARQFLHDLLANGPQTYAMIHQHAREAGVALSFLMAAKRSLHVQSHKSDGYAVWHLPAAA